MITKIQNYFLSQIKKTPFNDLVKDPDNQEILKGAGTTFSLKIIGLAFSYIFNILFARLYGAEVMGLFALAITVAGIFSLFAQIGTQTSVVRFVAQYAGQANFNAVKEIYRKT
jgi:O-antigen/teichoic acid export membrane protein